MLDKKHGFPQPTGGRGNRLRRGLDDHRRISDTGHVYLLNWERFVSFLQRRHILCPFATSYISLRNSWAKLVQMAKTQAEKGVIGRMEGHAAMDMSVSGGSFFSKLLSGKGLTAVSNFFVMDWASVWVDIVLGLLIAGALATWVPNSFWQAFFFTSNPTLAKIEGPLVGPLVAIVSFVCSVGNIPLAAVLWRGGISFGGVVSFIFADLITLPVLDIYRKYYGWKVMGYILLTFYITMAAAGYVVEFLFQALGIIPQDRKVVAITEGIQWNYTSILNIIFLVLAAILVIRFIRTGGIPMLRMMNTPEQEMAHHHG